MSRTYSKALEQKDTQIEDPVHSDTEIFQVTSDAHKTQVRELFWEYLQWANGMVNAEFGVNFDIHLMLEQDMAGLAKFAPPDGCLLLAEYKGQPVGLACMRKIGGDKGYIGELKRMYVRPEFRGKGIARVLLEGVIARAVQVGYPKLRLDSARFMAEAHRLYQAAGFMEIEAYEGSEIPQEFQEHWVFMELVLPEAVLG